MQGQKSYERVNISKWACRDVNEYYETIMKVGSGTYGEVNKAHLKSDHTQLVALKKIKDETETEGFPITALREIAILQQCDHPNIVRLIDIAGSKVTEAGSKKTRFVTVLVFEYMEHELLGLLDTYNFTPDQVKCVFKQILEGVAYLHTKNIIHRDIKSANILINNRGEVKVADFGLAKKINPMLSGKLTQRVVTRWYRAPELLLGSRKYTTQIDVWALGCVFAEILVGKGQALFPAQKTPDQFENICEKCGTPDEGEWPGHKSLPFYADMIPKNYTRNLMQHMRKIKSNIDPLGLDLLDKMLTMNPEQRITCKEALEHAYFTSEPLPCLLTEMPKFEKECHAHLLNEQRRQMHLANKNLLQQQQQQKSGQPQKGPIIQSNANQGKSQSKPSDGLGHKGSMKIEESANRTTVFSYIDSILEPSHHEKKNGHHEINGNKDKKEDEDRMVTTSDGQIKRKSSHNLDELEVLKKNVKK